MNHILSCKHSLELSAKKTIASLTLGERIWLRVHLLACVACRRIGKQVAIIERTLVLAQECGGWPPKVGSVALSETSRQRIKLALQQAGKSG